MSGENGTGPGIRLLLFDVGGVVIDFDFMRAFTAWEPISRLSCDEILRTFSHDLAYEQHERGDISSAEYFTHLRETLQLQDDPVRIEAGWNAIFLGEISDTVAMIQAVREQLPCYAFTNTNPAHHDTWSIMYPGVVSLFREVFASHRCGFRKPESGVFDYVCRRLCVPPQAILFFDDMIENVEAARRSGLSAVHVRSPADVRHALLSLDCALPLT